MVQVTAGEDIGRGAVVALGPDGKAYLYAALPGRNAPAAVADDAIAEGALVEIENGHARPIRMDADPATIVRPKDA